MTTSTALMNEAIWNNNVFTGSWRPSSGGAADVMEPATGERLSRVGLANASDVTAAARAAREAQPAWADMHYNERAEIFRKAARLLRELADEIRPWFILEQGSIPPKYDSERKPVALDSV